MSEGHGHGPNWYKLFVVSIIIFDLFLLLMVSQCTFTFGDALAAFDSVLCIVYIVFAILCFVVGNMISLIGIEHAKRKGRDYTFYYFAIIYFFASALAVVAYKFL